MRVFCALCGLFLAIAIVNCRTIVKRETEEDLSPLNEVYVVEADKDEAVDGERGDRDKRKIGLTVGIKNGILNFVFGKIDGFLDAKTKALIVLDESNKAKNAAFGIDPHNSATSQFISNLISQKIQSATGSIGPLINSATTLFSGASAGLTNALASKVAPLSSLSGGLSGGGSLSGGAGAGAGAAGGSNSAFIGNLLTQTLGSLSSLSQNSGGLGSLSSLSGGLSGGSGGSDSATENGIGASAGAGANIGAFANLAGYDYTPPQASF
ncbi:probable GH family 25 lysozyme 3 isoform X2 [Linepithema humile]|uniref:probable GH family 25 lysozyme 3 isoform X2 n=1 Tax=Linepithema humile TaxID=83485 RepID=UPI000623972D|nr:PREDICTED: putative lysozyme-like protein isoform X2 [Linepithema humile]